MGFIVSFFISASCFAHTTNDGAAGKPIANQSSKCPIVLERVIPSFLAIKQVQGAKKDYEEMAKMVHHYRRKVGYLGQSVFEAMDGGANELGGSILQKIANYKNSLIEAINFGQREINNDNGHMSRDVYQEYVFKIASYGEVLSKYVVLENTVKQLLSYSDPLGNKPPPKLYKH